MATNIASDKETAANRYPFSKTFDLKKLSSDVDKGIAMCFRRWGEIVVKRPYAVIVCTTIFALAWGYAFMAQLKIERDSDDLFTPRDAQAIKDFQYVETVFGFYSDRARILSVRNKDLVNKSDCTSKLLLRDENTARDTIQAFFKMYKQVLGHKVVYDGERFTLEDICIKASGSPPCQITSVLDLWKYNASEINANDFNPLEAINRNETLVDRFGFPLDYDLYVGKETEHPCEEDSKRSSNVEALAMMIVYEYEREEVDGAEIDPQSLEWAISSVNYVREISKGTVLDSYVADQNTVEDAVNESVQDDIQLLTFGYMLIFIYANVVLYKNSCLACKMHISIASIVGISFAVLAAFGIVQTFGKKINSIVQVLPFLILGLGIDDTFVIIGAYQRIDFNLPVEERISRTLERAGSSIFVTSMTDFLAFMMGMYSRLPALVAFSAYAAVSILFDFLYQVTFFVAFLVLEAKRERRYLNGAPWMGLRQNRQDTAEEEKTETTAPEPQEMQASTSKDLESSTPPNDERPELVPVSEDKAWDKICGSGRYDPSKPSFATKLIGSYLPSISLHPYGRIGVIVAECVLITWAIFGCTKVKMDFDFVDWFAPEGSSLEKAFDLESEYFTGEQVFFGVYTKEAERDYFYYQDELAALGPALEADPYVSGSVLTWYDAFSDWLRTESNYTRDLAEGLAPNATSFNLWLREYLDGPGALFAESVLFSNGSDPHIIASKIEASTVDITGGQQSIDLLDSIRATIESAARPLDPVPVATSFLFYDGYRIVVWETLRNIMLAAIGVFIMNAIVLANLLMAVIVVSMVLLTDLVVIGYMWYIDQYFNPVTAVNLVMIVGIAVDYSAHIAHSFLVLQGDRLSRAKAALDHIGGEVLSGAFTTWLGISVLGFAENYFFDSFFKMFFAIIVAGAWHGLVFLPVVLSFIGTEPYTGKTEEH